jgi:beta-glucosidase
MRYRNKIGQCWLATSLFVALAGRVAGQTVEPFRNPTLPIEQRVDSLLSTLTLDEKIALLSSYSTIPRFGINVGTAEGIHGLALGGPHPDRFKPIPTTIFPQGYGLGETWDQNALHLVGEVIGDEARYHYFNPNTGPWRFAPLIVMTPNADLGRDPRWGRTEECYGEDPFLNGSLVYSIVRGMQGDDPKYWRSASLLKHFLANSNEDGRDSSSSNFDERLWREYYSVPFRMGIMEGGARAFMAAYNAYEGIPCGANPMLRKITVDEWGNDGIICTDGGAMRQMVTAHHYYPDVAHAVAGTLKAGITKYLENCRPGLEVAMRKKLVTERDIDQAVRGNLRVLIRLGVFDPPGLVPYKKVADDPARSDAHKAAALKVTQESIVLLKNQGNLLPLDRQKIKSIAVIGPRADRVLLDWYSGSPYYSVSPLDGIKAAVGPNATVGFYDGTHVAAAAELAKTADVAIVCVGNDPVSGQFYGWGKSQSPSEGREAVDRKSIYLSHDQEALVKAVQAANPRTVLVLVSSFPYAINWEEGHVPAILHMAHCSQEEGSALASVLFGDYNPGGRLVQTWPRNLHQLPPMMDYDIRHGRTYMYFKGKPLFPFGFGLSYTQFKWSNMTVSSEKVAANGAVSVSVDVANVGDRAGDEVVELYAHHINSKVRRPRMQLCAFQRVTLQPGQTRTVTLDVPASRLAFWDVAGHRWKVENDKVELLAGPSSADLPLQRDLLVESGYFPATYSPDAIRTASTM